MSGPVSPVSAPSHGPITWSSCLHSRKRNIPAPLHSMWPSQAKWSHPSVWKGQRLWHGDSASPDNPLISKFKLSFLIPITQGSGLWAAPATPFIFITETFSPAAGNKGDYPKMNGTEREKDKIETHVKMWGRRGMMWASERKLKGQMGYRSWDLSKPHEGWEGDDSGEAVKVTDSRTKEGAKNHKSQTPSFSKLMTKYSADFNPKWHWGLAEVYI